jgi:uncharacterized integral membrane protein
MMSFDSTVIDRTLGCDSGSAPERAICARHDSQQRGGAFMVDRSVGDGTTTSRLTGGAIASLSGGGLLVIFMIQNTDDVNLDFLFWSFTWPLWLLCLVMALVGAIAWFGLGVLRRHRRRKERRADRGR